MKKLLGLVLIFLFVVSIGLVSMSYAVENQTDTKKDAIDVKDVKASVDIGENLTVLLEKLAKQIGTTADKIFPWYVKQQVLEGWLNIMSVAIALIIGSLFIFISYKKADWDEGNRYSVLSIGGMIAFAVTLLIGLCGLTNNFSQIINPNYYALKSITQDLARLVGK